MEPNKNLLLTFYISELPEPEMIYYRNDNVSALGLHWVEFSKPFVSTLLGLIEINSRYLIADRSVTPCGFRETKHFVIKFVFVRYS